MLTKITVSWHYTGPYYTLTVSEGHSTTGHNIFELSLNRCENCSVLLFSFSAHYNKETWKKGDVLQLNSENEYTLDFNDDTDQPVSLHMLFLHNMNEDIWDGFLTFKSWRGTYLKSTQITL